ncbi:hypothetical protein T484DRAFT_1919015 [Baffinella frigidus]|nr:hypothetical protein T484DRAFT_1919015 [Cryptophyta sp. CCMP2293]
MYKGEEEVKYETGACKKLEEQVAHWQRLSKSKHKSYLAALEKARQREECAEDRAAEHETSSKELEDKGEQLRGIEQHMRELEEEHAALTASVRDLSRKRNGL